MLAYLSNPEVFVGLHRQPPARSSQAELDRLASVLLPVLIIEWLDDEVAKLEMLQRCRFKSRLRIDDLQFVARRLKQVSSSLRTHADPVDVTGSDLRPIGLDGDLEASLVESAHERFVKLK